MICLVTALHAEAKPLIAYFRLKRDVDLPGHSVFRASSICLIESGVGKIKSAVAAARILCGQKSPAQTAAVNVGVCGAVAGASVGGLFRAHKIIDHATKRAYYPDLLGLPPLEEAVVETCDWVVKERNGLDPQTALVDMEASGFFEAASSFLGPERISCLKVVADACEGERLTDDAAAGLIEMNLTRIEEQLRGAERWSVSARMALGEADSKIIDAVSHSLRLTCAQKKVLAQEAQSALARAGKPAEVLKNFLNLRPQGKAEAKEAFRRVMAALRAGS